MLSKNIGPFVASKTNVRPDMSIVSGGLPVEVCLSNLAQYRGVCVRVVDACALDYGVQFLEGSRAIRQNNQFLMPRGLFEC